MAYEKMVKRTMWRAKCDTEGCETDHQYVEHPPRSVRCMPCGKWLDVVETSVVEKELDGKAAR